MPYPIEDAEVVHVSEGLIEIWCDGTRYRAFAGTFQPFMKVIPVGLVQPKSAAHEFAVDGGLLHESYVAEKFKLNRGIDSQVATLCVAFLLNRPCWVGGDGIEDISEWAMTHRKAN